MGSPLWSAQDPSPIYFVQKSFVGLLKNGQEFKQQNKESTSMQLNQMAAIATASANSLSWKNAAVQQKLENPHNTTSKTLA